MITFFLISGEQKKRKLPVQEYTDCAKVRKSVKRNKEEVGVFGIAKNSKVLFGLLPPGNRFCGKSYLLFAKN